MKLTASQLQDDCAVALDAAAYREERIMITKHGKLVAALISADDLELFEALEDAADLRLIAEAKAESDERIPLEDALAELDL